MGAASAVPRQARSAPTLTAAGARGRREPACPHPIASGTPGRRSWLLRFVRTVRVRSRDLYAVGSRIATKHESRDDRSELRITYQSERLGVSTPAPMPIVCLATLMSRPSHRVRGDAAAAARSGNSASRAPTWSARAVISPLRARRVSCWWVSGRPVRSSPVAMDATRGATPLSSRCASSPPCSNRTTLPAPTRRS
jgi:hypothetical protein